MAQLLSYTVTVALSAITALIAADHKYDLFQLPLPAPSGPVKRLDPSYFPKYGDFEGKFKKNSILQTAGVRLFPGQIQSPETLASDGGDAMYMADHHNYLRKAEHLGSSLVGLGEPLQHIGHGRVLGVEFDRDGNLIMCTAGIGLQMVENSTGRVVTLAARVADDSPLEPGSTINYAEDLAIAGDGTIYFTDGCYIPPIAPDFDLMRPLNLVAFQGAVTGRLLAYSPVTKKATVLATGFWFANGCALSADESYILVADTLPARVLKYHLKGPKAGETEVLIDGLPGHPDNIRTAKDGTFWVALSAALREAMFPVLPFKHIRALCAWLPPFLLPKDKPFAGLVQMTGDGEVLRFLMDGEGKTLLMTTAVTEGPDGLYIGSFAADFVGFIAYRDLPPISSG